MDNMITAASRGVATGAPELTQGLLIRSLNLFTVWIDSLLSTSLLRGLLFGSIALFILVFLLGTIMKWSKDASVRWYIDVLVRLFGILVAMVIAFAPHQDAHGPDKKGPEVQEPPVDPLEPERTTIDIYARVIGNTRLRDGPMRLRSFTRTDFIMSEDNSTRAMTEFEIIKRRFVFVVDRRSISWDHAKNLSHVGNLLVDFVVRYDIDVEAQAKTDDVYLVNISGELNPSEFSSNADLADRIKNPDTKPYGSGTQWSDDGKLESYLSGKLRPLDVGWTTILLFSLAGDGFVNGLQETLGEAADIHLVRPDEAFNTEAIISNVDRTLRPDYRLRTNVVEETPRGMCNVLDIDIANRSDLSVEFSVALVDRDGNTGGGPVHCTQSNE